ncbi:hypothetical protein KEM55_003523 [Ascosphaera atra]|nr:hypothetical protein KEM55_003523 [Ascosphaera atra]
MSVAETIHQFSSLENYTGFIRVTRDTYLREPPVEAGPNYAPSTAPTILLLFWMNAPVRPMIKYIAGYIKYADSIGARIICMTTSSLDFLLRWPERMQARRVAPVVAALTSPLSLSEKSALGANPAPLYIHVFSNGGLYTLSHIARQYRAMTDRPLPAKSIIIDSAPGQPSLLQSYRAFRIGLPTFLPVRIIASIILFSTLATYSFFNSIFKSLNANDVARAAMNNPAIVAITAKRTYIYSDADDVIPSPHVEAHAAEAEREGWNVSMRLFKGSPHCGHMRHDPSRYWRIVSTTTGLDKFK